MEIANYFKIPLLVCEYDSSIFLKKKFKLKNTWREIFLQLIRDTENIIPKTRIPPLCEINEIPQHN